MATSATHRGWLQNHNYGLLSAVYNGAQPGTTILGANTAVDGILVGTPVSPALAVDSLVLSNLVASGDILLAANNGGNSQAWLGVDSSAGTMTLYGAGVAQAILTSSALTVQDDILLGLGTGSTARLSYDTTDANSNQLLLQLPAAGSVDTPALIIGQSVESVDFGSAGIDYSGVVDPTVAVLSSGAVTTGPVLEFRKARGTSAAPTVCTTGDDVGQIKFYGAVAANEYVQTASIEADIAGTIATTRGPGTLIFKTATDAAPSVLTAALTISAAQLVTCAAGVTVTTGTVTISAGNLAFSAASDITIPAATAAALEVSDGTTKFYAIDTRVTTKAVTTHALDISDYTLASAADAVVTGLALASHTLNFTGSTQVTSVANTVNLGARSLVGAAAITVDQANTVSVVAPTEGTNVTLSAASAVRVTNASGTPTTQYGIYLEDLTAGATSDYAIYIAGADTAAIYIAADPIQFGAADDIVFPAATAAALELSDGTTKFYAIDTRVATTGVTTHALDISDYTFASAAGAVATGLSLAAHTLNLTGNTQVTSAANTASIGARTIAGAEAITVDQANTLSVIAPIEGTNVTLTATSAIRIATTTGTPTNQYGLYVDSLTGGTTLNRGIYLAGANSIQFGAADDIVFPAATAAALELSDGTTKFYAIDTRVANVGVTTHALDISDYTLASAAGAVATGLSLAAHTLNLTGNTQVTTQCDTAVVGARTIAADGVPGACTVDEANSVLLVAPTEGTNAVLTAASALRVINAGGTPVNQYGIYIEDLTVGATADYGIYIAGADTAAIYVASADPIHLGVAGASTGKIEMDGATSGTVTLTVAATAGTWTMTLPAAVGGAGEQLTDAAANGVCSWAAAASLREYKDILGEHDAEDALSVLLDTKVYDFHFKPGVATQDSQTIYTGVIADEAPWAMHYRGRIVNPINSLGYTLLGIQALERRLREIEAKLN